MINPRQLSELKSLLRMSPAAARNAARRLGVPDIPDDDDEFREFLSELTPVKSSAEPTRVTPTGAVMFDVEAQVSGTLSGTEYFVEDVFGTFRDQVDLTGFIDDGEFDEDAFRNWLTEEADIRNLNFDYGDRDTTDAETTGIETDEIDNLEELVDNARGIVETYLEEQEDIDDE